MEYFLFQVKFKQPKDQRVSVSQCWTLWRVVDRKAHGYIWWWKFICSCLKDPQGQSRSCPQNAFTLHSL